MITETIKLTQVSQNEKNPRKITEGNLKKLINSILVFPISEVLKADFMQSL